MSLKWLNYTMMKMCEMELTMVGGPAPRKGSSRQRPRDDDLYEATAQGRRSQGPAELTVVGGPAPSKDSSRQGPRDDDWYEATVQGRRS